MCLYVDMYICVQVLTEASRGHPLKWVIGTERG